MWLLFVLIGYNILSEFALKSGNTSCWKTGIRVLHVYWLAQMLPATAANYRHVFSSSKSTSAHCLPRATFWTNSGSYQNLIFPPSASDAEKSREGKTTKNNNHLSCASFALGCVKCFAFGQDLCWHYQFVWIFRILSFVTNHLWGLRNECYFVHFSHFWWC